ncbi:MAG: tryptophan synthase subunit alpha [Buchnera aphidicola (Eriosoma harunire)]
MTTRYKSLFHNVFLKKEICFIPFLILGDPTIEISLKIIDSLINNGVDAIELGFPFSDPMADGPIIQRANLRAFKAKVTVKKCLDMVHIIRKKHKNIPIGLLLYSNLIVQKGIYHFYSQCNKIGIDSILIADVPVEEYNIFYKAATLYNIDPIFICPPNAEEKLIQKIIKYSKGYIYMLSRPGVTGFHKNYNDNISFLIKKLKKITSIPLVQGFGIHNTEQIKNIIQFGLNGVICGSVLINIIEKYSHNIKKMLNMLVSLSIQLKNSTKL